MTNYPNIQGYYETTKLQDDVFDYLGHLFDELSDIVYSIPDGTLSDDMMERLDDCLTSIACHQDIFNGSEYADNN